MLDYFLSMLMLVFAVASIIAGIFTAYFGSGKSRVVGAILIIIGLLVGFMFLWFAGLIPFLGTVSITWAGKDIVINSIAAVVGAVIGALIAVGLFLLAIMKS